MNKKILIMVITVALLVGATVGGTVAWLVDTTDTITNTFTYGDIDIELAETTGTEYKIVPGNNITKDPTVTVKNGSEACWLFVKIDETNWPAVKTADDAARKVDYAIAETWMALDKNDGIYYCEVEAASADMTFVVLMNNEIVVSDELTKEEVASLKADSAPTLQLKAYAVQKSSAQTAAEAWILINAN